MRRIASSNGLFVNGNPGNGTPGTIVTAEWLNAVQEEIVSVLTAAGVAIDPVKTDQLSTALNTLLRGRATVNVAGGVSVSLTPAQHGLPILILTGALTANINVIFPATTGTWVVRNQTTGPFTVTCKTAAGSGVVVSQGTSNALWGDGTSIHAEQSDWASIPMGSYRGFRNLTANTVLTAADAGFYIGIAAGGLAVTLPPGSALPPGTQLTFGAASPFTLLAPAGNTLSGPNAPGQTSMVMSGFCSVVWRGDFWQVLLGGDQSLLAPIGWKRFPDGTLLQWGIAANSAADMSITFPLAFPNACLVVQGTCGYTPGSAAIGFVACGGWSTTGFTCRPSNSNLGWQWFAIGR